MKVKYSQGKKNHSSDEEEVNCGQVEEFSRRILCEAIPICIIDKDHNIIQWNDMFHGFYQSDSKISTYVKCHDIFQSPFCHGSDCPINAILGGIDQYEYELEMRQFESGKKFFMVISTPFYAENNRINGIINHLVDITRLKETKAELREACERLVTEQVALKNKNLALKEILNRIDIEKSKIAERVEININRAINPLIRRLKEKANSIELEYVLQLEKSLNEITSPFMSRLESRHSMLTPREIEISKMVRDGLSCKDIATMFDISEQTVIRHRKRIRKKLGITNSRINLASHLKSTIS